MRQQTSTIIIANDLNTGRSVYLTAEHQWSEILTHAAHAMDVDESDRLLAVAVLSESRAEVIAPYQITTDSSGNPTVRRERIRARGPSIQYLRSTDTKAANHVSV